MTAEQLKKQITAEQILQIMRQLGINEWQDDDGFFIFPTCCHNANLEEASMKLYYYKDTHLFHCYTECGDSFDIFEFLQRYFKARGQDKSFREIFEMVQNKTGIIDINFDTYEYESEAEKFVRKRKEIDMPTVPIEVLNAFSKYYTPEWLEEGITKETMDKYDILFSHTQNKIIIPHFDINGNLVGIRGRALNPEDIEKGKYRPIWLEGKQYNHPLSLNLYGLNKTLPAVNKTRQIILFESEKSVLMMDSYFKLNNSAAVCGSNLNKNQINLLLKHTKAAEIILAFDKEYEHHASQKAEEYFNKLRSIGRKYNKYFTFYYMADKENLLNEKDSPIDKGPEVFTRLFEKKCKIGEKYK